MGGIIKLKFDLEGYYVLAPSCSYLKIVGIQEKYSKVIASALFAEYLFTQY